MSTNNRSARVFYVLVHFSVVLCEMTKLKFRGEREHKPDGEFFILFLILNAIPTNLVGVFFYHFGSLKQSRSSTDDETKLYFQVTFPLALPSSIGKVPDSGNRMTS